MTGNLALWQLAELLDQFQSFRRRKRKRTKGNCGAPERFSVVLKSKLGEVAYWLGGTVGVVLGDLAVRHAGHQLSPNQHSDPTSAIFAG